MSTEKQAKFRLQSTVAAEKVDAEAGVIRDVALVSVGEAAGWDLRADLKSLQGFFELINGRSVKAFINHGDDPKPTEAIGLYSGFYIDNASEPPALRASQLQVFKSFRENNRAEYDTLFELAASGPDAFGLSADFHFQAEAASDGGNPFVRPTHVNSFDIVGAPAINKGLFAKKPLDNSQNTVNAVAPVVETESQSQSQQADFSTSPKPKTSPMKAVFSHFAGNAKALPLIAKFTAELPEDATAEAIISKVQFALSEEEAAAVVAERDALKLQVETLTAKVAELTPAAESEAECSKKLAAVEAEFSTLKAEYGKLTARFGTKPLKVGASPEPSAAALKCTKAEFDAKTPAQKAEFSRNGGRISD